MQSPEKGNVDNMSEKCWKNCPEGLKTQAEDVFGQFLPILSMPLFADPVQDSRPLQFFWRQIWRVAGRESGSPELLGSPRTSPEVPRTSPKVFGDFPGSPLTVELNSNPEVPRKFPKLPRKFPKLPRKFRDSPGGQPLSLGSLTPSPDSQKLSLIFGGSQRAGWDFGEWERKIHHVM